MPNTKLLMRNMSALLILISIATSTPTRAESGPIAISPAELEHRRLAEIVAGIDQLLNQVDVASRTGANGRIRFDFQALRRDLLGRRELIQRYINSSWDAPRDIAPQATTYFAR